jgi:hypothetical protein
VSKQQKCGTMYNINKTKNTKINNRSMYKQGAANFYQVKMLYLDQLETRKNGLKFAIQIENFEPLVVVNTILL